MRDVAAKQCRHQQRHVKLSERAWSYFQDQDISLELRGGLLPLIGSGSYSTSKVWALMGRRARGPSKRLYRQRRAATATCASSVTCRRDCLCTHHFLSPSPVGLGRVLVFSIINPHEPFRIFLSTATSLSSATISHKAWYSHLDLFVKIARAVQLLLDLIL